MATSTSRGSHSFASTESEAIEVESSNSKKNIWWNTEMDTCLTDALMEQMEKGNKIDRSFTSSAYEAVREVMCEKFSEKFTVSNVKNRLKTLKHDMGAFQDMLKFGSGFAFNRTTRMMDADPKVWDVYLKAHPNARNFRHKKVPCFENLILLFGSDRATGHDAETAKERRLRLERETTEFNLVGDKEAAENNRESGGDPNEPSNASSEVPSSSKGSKKRKGGASGASSLHEDFKMLKASLDNVASSYGQSSPRAIPEDALFKEVEKIEGLGGDDQLLAYDFLCGDAVRGRTFIGMPLNRRKRWLELKLGRELGE